MKKILLHFLLAFLLTVPSFGQDVFINEIKYQAPSGDFFVEVSGPTGTNITGWEVILYDDAALPYDTLLLDGALPSTSGCNDIIIVDVALLFNTPGSGMALVNEQAQLVQYLTYGGENTGTIPGTVIYEQTSENIGMIDPDGVSFQLTGFGVNYQNFIWEVFNVATPGEANIGQEFDDTGCTLPLVLPVELVGFEGNLIEENIALTWMTLSETNHSHFEVLHSTDGVEMKEVGRVFEAKSESGGAKKYEFIFDNMTHTNNYFQLRQVDIDGQSELSPVVSVISNRKDEPVKIAPNPATDFIDIDVRFNSIGTDDANVMIIDSQGKTVFSKQTTLSELDRISIAYLESGLYILVVQTRTVSNQLKFFKQKE